MTGSTAIEGGCHCGTVRYRIDGEIDWVAHCHCDMCRKASGGTVMTWLRVPAKALRFTGDEPQRYQSSRQLFRSHCPVCGAQIHCAADDEPGWAYVTVASLDRPEEVPPGRADWTADALPWITLDPHLPTNPGEPPDNAVGDQGS